MKKERLMPYALDENNTIVTIEEVGNGLSCKCYCPACHGRLIARKGKKRIPHFAHYKNKTHCKHGYETSLHIGAKRIISEAGFIWLPQLNSTVSGIDGEATILSSDTYPIDGIECEKKENDVIPDLIAIINDIKIYIEIYVTHRIDDNKLSKLKKHNIPTVEIDLSNLDASISPEQFRKILLQESGQKSWIYHPDQQYLGDILCKYCKRIEFVNYQNEQRTACSFHMRVDQNKYYALPSDCNTCKYCFRESDTESQYCGHYYGLSQITQLLALLKNPQMTVSVSKDINPNPLAFHRKSGSPSISMGKPSSYKPTFSTNTEKKVNCNCPLCNSYLVIALKDHMPAVVCTNTEKCGYYKFIKDDSVEVEYNQLYYDSRYNR